MTSSTMTLSCLSWTSCMDDIEVGRYALRTFRLTSARKARLISLNSMGSHNPAWTDGTCSAVCLRSSLYHPNSSGVCEPPHESPSISCTCGIYGSLSYRDLLDQYGYNVTRILAIIAAEGTTLIGSRGLRTQYARVVAFNAMDSQYKKPLSDSSTGLGNTPTPSQCWTITGSHCALKRAFP